MAKTTEQVKIPEKLIDQVIGQKKAAEIIKKAAKQRRNVLLIGSPGTGKTMLAQAMAELLPAADLEDVLVYKNINDENAPLVKSVKTYPDAKSLEKLGDGQGRLIVQKERIKNRMGMNKGNSAIGPIVTILVLFLVGLTLFGFITGYEIILVAALILGIMIFGSVALLMSGLARRVGFPGMMDVNEPKLIVDNTGMSHAPFIDATGSKAGALFGDCRHDPLQCIPSGENILLSNGNLKPIDKIIDPYFEGDSEGEIEISPSNDLMVLGGFDSNYKLSYSHVMRLYRRKYSDKLIKIKTRSGSRIKVTPNHPLAMISKNGIVQYVEAGKINSDTRLIIPERIEIKHSENTIDEKLLVFIADILADGYINNTRIEFSLKNQFKIENIKKDISALGYVPRIGTRKDNGATKICLNSSALCRKLLGMGIKDGKEKRIPNEVFNQSKERQVLFLSRLLSLDGYINYQGQFEILSSSKVFIQQIRALAFTLSMNAKYKTRIDSGFGKEKSTIQHMIRWNHLEFAKAYNENTINPTHKRNLEVYLNNTTFNKESYYDVVPIGFETLESIRGNLGVSKERINSDFWSLNPNVNNNKNITRNMLYKVSNKLLDLGAAKDDATRLRNPSMGDYAFDEIISIDEENYEGFVYNFTTETGNYLVDFVLTHNSGGLGTPAHLRVESGAIHKANKGVLFIDEIANLEPRAQQELLTSMQEKKYSITGQSEMSSGALVKTEPAPADFLLIAAGNLQDIQHMHPALRSRIRGYGYEVYMDSTMEDNATNRGLLVQFIAQEIKKDGKIPQFDQSAIDEVIEEARRRAGRKKRLTLILRDLGGLVRAAGDIAIEKKKKYVTKEEVRAAKQLASPIEAQVVAQELEFRKDYRVFNTSGFAVGKVNGLAVMGGSSSTFAGIVIPIVSEVTPAGSRSEGKFIPTGKLGKIATEAVKNVSAVIKKHMGKDIANYDMHVQFIQIEGVEGDSASISVAVSIISAMENVPIDQSLAMTGSLSVRGEVLPVGGVTSKVEAAISAGIKKVILPASNLDDVSLPKDKLRSIKLIPVKTFADVLKYSLKDCSRKDEIIKELQSYEKNDGRKGIAGENFIKDNTAEKAAKPPAAIKRRKPARRKTAKRKSKSRPK
jgi:lon-related putative ATP-dependent protease